MSGELTVRYPTSAFLFRHQGQGETHWWVIFRNGRLELMLRKSEQEEFPTRFRDHPQKFLVELREHTSDADIKVVFLLRESQQQRERGGWTPFTLSLVTAWAKFADLTSLGVTRIRYATGEASADGEFPHLSSAERADLFPAIDGRKPGSLEAILHSVELIREAPAAAH